MGLPIPKNQEYINSIRELKLTCKYLAQQYDLHATSTLDTFYQDPDPNQVTLCPPVDGQIILRNHYSQLVASVEPRDHYDHNKKSLVLDEVVMRIYEAGCNDNSKMEALVKSFLDKYPLEDSFSENHDNRLEGKVLLVKEHKL